MSFYLIFKSRKQAEFSWLESFSWIYQRIGWKLFKWPKIFVKLKGYNAYYVRIQCLLRNDTDPERDRQKIAKTKWHDFDLVFATFWRWFWAWRRPFSKNFIKKDFLVSQIRIFWGVVRPNRTLRREVSFWAQICPNR